MRSSEGNQKARIIAVATSPILQERENRTYLLYLSEARVLEELHQRVTVATANHEHPARVENVA